MLFAVGSQIAGTVEVPMELMINVIDQNDNRPEFTQNIFRGNVPEGVPPATSVMTISATDADDPETDNAKLGYSIVSQEPKLPYPEMFTVNKETGVISTLAAGLDREAIEEYTLILQVADMNGEGLTNTATAIISVTDGNDNAPQFDPTSYEGSAPENKVGHEIVRLIVTDKDVPHSSAWVAVYSILKGNEGGFFNITTDSESNQGILKTVKELDFETTSKYTLIVIVKNQAPFSIPNLSTSTSTITVSVTDVNESPIFTPTEYRVDILENLTMGQMVAFYPAKDPDTAQKQTVTYEIGSDPASWLEINTETGIIKSKAQLDRESDFVENDIYKALVLAKDDGIPKAIGTGTLLLKLIDVNDNAPEPDQRSFIICNENPYPVSLNIIDKDLPPHTHPFKAKLMMNSEKNWTAVVQDNQVSLNMTRTLEPDTHKIYLQLEDNGSKTQTTVVTATVCQCVGQDVNCESRIFNAGVGLPTILAILGGILALLILLLVLLLFARRKKTKKEPLLPEDDTRDNVFYYDEEGGGEEDQEFDLSQLHRGLDNRPEVTRNDVIPVLMPAPQYRPRPANPDEIGDFINENLKAADNDPTAPPYDSLLVFDYEGTGSEVGSLSSLNSSSSGEHDYEYLNEWGPRFKKLADMYGGDDD
ncbi:B-cadherin-like [Protopterus annectens]|uniref:B-cadherin-like n=1 Tax=Protopterus annectens TaxID=7888 RepID=UPI001CFC3BB0|nr:B-cadherin-like [Protopterus annectens]